MFTIKQYVKAASLKEAWELNQKRVNSIIGGMGWMKMTRGDISTAIDLMGLGLNEITETKDEFIIGAMVTLRQFETDEALNSCFNGTPKESVRHIVGVQFRNCATMGGTLWLRPGFSDPITLLLALDTTIELYTGEDEHALIPLSEFITMKKNNDIVVAIHIRKDGRKVSYESFRNTETDLPVLAVALANKGDIYIASVGARPGLARLVEAKTQEELIKQAKGLTYSKNIRGSAEYRRMLAGVLIERAAKRLEE